MISRFEAGYANLRKFLIGAVRTLLMQTDNLSLAYGAAIKNLQIPTNRLSQLSQKSLTIAGNNFFNIKALRPFFENKGSRR